jgi:hypothetical protein
MCFSASASFTAGAALLAVGAFTTSRIRRPAELPFALIPALFGVQQLIEGGVWLTFPDKASNLNAILTYLYSFFSHVLWPIYVPIAVLLLEVVPWRRKALTAIALAGAAVGLYLMYFLITEPILAQVVGHHIAYLSPHFYVVPVIILYVLGTCVSAFLSSCGTIRWFGVVTFISLVVAYVFYAFWFISVWCFFAALLSVVVVVHFRGAKPLPRSPEDQPAAE